MCCVWGVDLVIEPKPEMVSHFRWMQKHSRFSRISDLHVGVRVGLGMESMLPNFPPSPPNNPAVTPTNLPLDWNPTLAPTPPLRNRHLLPPNLLPSPTKHPAVTAGCHSGMEIGWPTNMESCYGANPPLLLDRAKPSPHDPISPLCKTVTSFRQTSSLLLSSLELSDTQGLWALNTSPPRNRYTFL